eukprot:TRINITY_DN50588_c0_g1_i1.p1 TRINITY_DN50588_c0_g1~~TRINITY_DN50588_c0_g1_i1.p1  ORF type:complete len:934 (+),score=221.65 TRINITY_DN50588_c0_g1_i1:124-2925(+)
MQDDSVEPPASVAGGRPCSFRIFSDRGAAALEAFEWNPHMDLLACLTAPPDSTLTIYRCVLVEVQNQKLLSEKVAGIGTALAWSPCGRRVAVGDRHGCISVYDGETGVVLRSQRLHRQPVVALSWLAADAATSEAPLWSKSMLPPLLSVPSAPSNMYAEAQEGDEGGDAVFSLLTSADEGGTVVVSAGGTLALQRTHVVGDVASGCRPMCSDGYGGTVPAVASPLAGSSPAAASWPSSHRRIRAVRLSPDLRTLAVMMGRATPSCSSTSRSPPGARATSSSPCEATPQAAAPSRGLASPSYDADSGVVSNGVAASLAAAAADGRGSAGSQNGAMSTPGRPGDDMVLLLDVRKLAVRRREISQCSSMVERLSSVVNYTRQAVDALSHAWRSSADAFAKKMRGLSEAISPEALKAGMTAQEELLLTCCTGTPSDAVHAFLTRQTSPQQLARLERNLLQALEYVNLVTCTRLQVAGQHLMVTLQELSACASWAQKFRVLGLEVAALEGLLQKTEDFARLTELLLLDASQARRLVRTLFQVLLRMAHRLADPPVPAAAGQEAPPAATGPAPPPPSAEDMADFMSCMEARQSLDLREVTERIGAAMASVSGGGRSGSLNSNKATGGATSGTAVHNPSVPLSPAAAAHQAPADTAPASLAEAVQALAAATETLATSLERAVSSRTLPLAAIPVWAPSPWQSISVPELRGAALQAAAGAGGTTAMSPRGFGGSTLSMAWEDTSKADAAGSSRLMLLWSGGDGDEAELHACRLTITPAPPSAPVPPKLERLRLRVGSAKGKPSHFLLCQMYNATEAVVLVLNEQPRDGGTNGATISLCLVDFEGCKFTPVKRLSGGGETSDAMPPRAPPGDCQLPAAVSLDQLPREFVRRSAPLPESYVWASDLRAMSTRGVCSVYARRARRLVTLDMEAEEDDESDEDES